MREVMKKTILTLAIPQAAMPGSIHADGLCIVAKVEFIWDDSEWELLSMRADDPADNVYRT